MLASSNLAHSVYWYIVCLYSSWLCFYVQQHLLAQLCRAILVMSSMSVCLSVTCWYSVRTNDHRIMRLLPSIIIAWRTYYCVLPNMISCMPFHLVQFSVTLNDCNIQFYMYITFSAASGCVSYLAYGWHFAYTCCVHLCDQMHVMVTLCCVSDSWMTCYDIDTWLTQLAGLPV